MNFQYSIQNNQCSIKNGFRQMDVQLGRWHVVDAMAEKYFSKSPYSYAGNNPINFIDILGLSYTYNWTTGNYENSSGDVVSWGEVSDWLDIGGGGNSGSNGGFGDGGGGVGFGDGSSSGIMGKAMHGNFWKSWAGKTLMRFGGWKASDWKANDYQWYTKKYDKDPPSSYIPADLGGNNPLYELSASMSYMWKNGGDWARDIKIEKLINYKNANRRLKRKSGVATGGSYAGNLSNSSYITIRPPKSSAGFYVFDSISLFSPNIGKRYEISHYNMKQGNFPLKNVGTRRNYTYRYEIKIDGYFIFNGGQERPNNIATIRFNSWIVFERVVNTIINGPYPGYWK